MKGLVLVLAVGAATLSGCAQFNDWYHEQSASAGPTAPEQQGPFPKPRYQPNFQSW